MAVVDSADTASIATGTGAGVATAVARTADFVWATGVASANVSEVAAGTTMGCEQLGQGIFLPAEVAAAENLFWHRGQLNLICAVDMFWLAAGGGGLPGVLVF